MSQTLALRELCAHFKDRAERSGAQVLEVADLIAAAQGIAATLAQKDGGPIVAPASIATDPEFKAALGEKLIEVTGTASITGATAGVSWGEFGISETGSVVYAVNNLLERQVAMLSPIYFALVHAETLVSNLDEAGVRVKKLQTQEGRRYISFVTGPSRTADIERVLTVGVQGPKELYVVLVGSVDN